VEERIGFDFYEYQADRWNALSRAEKKAQQAEIAQQGGHIDGEGRRVFYYIEIIDNAGEFSVMLHPEVYRARALDGDEQAIEYCDKRGIPWRDGDAAFRQWFAGWYRMKADRVAAKRKGIQQGTAYTPHGAGGWND
jgi:hypothetical protein